MATINANQLAVLVAVYRGFDVALNVERQRGNFETDVLTLRRAGLIVIYNLGRINERMEATAAAIDLLMLGMGKQPAYAKVS